MSLDNNTGELERYQLLDEIRKRAEEAEFARIEAEEARLVQSSNAEIAPLLAAYTSSLGETGDSSTIQYLPPPLLNNDAEDNCSLPGKPFSVHHAHVNVEEIESHIADITHAHALQHSKQSELDQVKKLKQIAELLVSANSNYQSEHYERASRELRELLALDPYNTDAAALASKVEKAKALSERMAEEEQQRRMEEEEEAKQQPVPLPRMKREKVSESPLIPAAQLSEFVETRTEAPETTDVQDPKLKRSFVLLAIGALALLGIVTTLVVFDNIRDKFFSKHVNVLVLPPTSSNVDAYVAGGLMDDLVARLSHLRNVRVFSATMILGVHDSDVVKTARLYSANFVLQWDVSAVQEMLRTKLLLIDVESSKRVLDQTSTVSQGSLPEYWGGMSSSIASALNVDASWTPGAFNSPSTNQNAYDAYLCGRFLLTHPELASLDSVASVFERSCQRDPTSPYAEAALGWTNVLLHAASADTSGVHLDKAAENLKRSLNLGGSSSEVYRLWGVTEYFRTQYTQAITRLEHATTIAPSDAEAHQWLALAYLRVGKNGEALAAARRASEMRPSSHASRSMLGMVYLANGDAKAAVREFEPYVRLHQDSLSSPLDEYLVALVMTNQHERALDILKRRTHAHPHDFIARYDLGRMFQLAGKAKSDWKKALQESLQLIEDTLKVNPTHSLAYSYRGLVQTRLGLFAEGIKSNKQAISIAPSDAVVLYNSARMYALQQNQSSEGFAYLARAIRKRFSLEHVLDLDLLSLRHGAEFLCKVSQ